MDCDSGIGQDKENIAGGDGVACRLELREETGRESLSGCKKQEVLISP